MGVRVFITYLPNSLLESDGLVWLICQIAVEAGHKVKRAAILDIPESQQRRPGARVDKTPNESEEFIASGHCVHARGTTAQGDQIRRKLEAI